MLECIYFEKTYYYNSIYFKFSIKYAYLKNNILFIVHMLKKTYTFIIYKTLLK